MGHLSTGLLSLPNEMLFEIIAWVNPPGLTRLSRVNHRLHVLVADYLVRHTHGLAALPNEIILEIIQHLGRHDLSRLARASHRFYPLVMDSILRYNVQKMGSSLLNFAAKNNLKRMVRRIIHRGGDINTQHGYRLGAERTTPLVLAVVFGHGDMVKMLLGFGAIPSTHGKFTPLTVAIFQRHENVAVILCEALDPAGRPLIPVGGETLQMAAAAKLVGLVKYLLERRSRSNVKRTDDLDAALYRILLKDASKADIFKRELYQDVFQIVMMLLQHGAHPDVLPNFKGTSKFGTARALASRHPDPRVRALLSKGKHLNTSRESDLQIGRSWTVTPETMAPTFLVASYCDEGRYARLWDFLEGSNAGLSAIMDDGSSSIDQGAETRRTADEGYISICSDSADWLEDGSMQDLKQGAEPAEPPPLLSFPQLGTPPLCVQNKARDLWANASPDVRVSYAPRSRATGVNPQTVKRREKPAQTEQFPQLVQTQLTSVNTGKELWAAFSKGKATPKSREPQRTATTTASKNGHGTQQHVSKASKKKKRWEPLSL